MHSPNAATPPAQNKSGQNVDHWPPIQAHPDRSDWAETESKPPLVASPPKRPALPTGSSQSGPKHATNERIRPAPKRITGTGPGNNPPRAHIKIVPTTAAGKYSIPTPSPTSQPAPNSLPVTANWRDPKMDRIPTDSTWP